MRMKIRHKNWYWGRWVFSGSKVDNSIVTIRTKDFELYDDELHGWHHSEEYKKKVKGFNTPFEMLKHHVSGAIERSEKEAVTSKVN